MLQHGKTIRYRLNRILGIPGRFLMRIAARQYPQRQHDGVRLVVADSWLVASAERFFERTTDALTLASISAPEAYANFRRDVEQVFLWGERNALPYNRFQLAAVVPPSIALEAGAACYAAWLLHISGLLVSEAEAKARSDALLWSLGPEERNRVAGWLANVSGRGPP
jgi:hypothetical protein